MCISTAKSPMEQRVRIQNAMVNLKTTFAQKILIPSFLTYKKEVNIILKKLKHTVAFEKRF